MSATYHGITKATCLNCGRMTTELEELTYMNDLDSICFKCECRFTKWETVDGVIITCEMEDYQGGTYTFREEIK